jgi:peroxiredoxin/DNA-binding transcriptional MerR regulator
MARVEEVIRRTGASRRALRYYEQRGLVVPRRQRNGYRDYDELAVRKIGIIRDLSELGLSVADTRPFLDCLETGHRHADDCLASLGAYRRAIDDLSARIARLIEQRDALNVQLDAAAARAVTPAEGRRPARRRSAGIPATGAVASLMEGCGRPMPPVTLEATDGSIVDLAALGPGRTVLFIYPLTGRPGVDLPDGWNTIPGARGCTAEAEGFRSRFRDFVRVGVEVFGVSTQSTTYQRDVVDRLRLPYRLLADPTLRLADELSLPTLAVDGRTFYQRLTLIVHDGQLAHVLHPVEYPARHAADVLDWLARRDDSPPPPGAGREERTSTVRR